MLMRTFKKMAWPAFIVYMMVLVMLILLKEPYRFLSAIQHFGPDNIKAGERNLDLIPFTTTSTLLLGKSTLWDIIKNIGGNIVGFVPMGVLLPTLFAKLDKGWKVILCVFLISLAFEATQFIVGVGYCDVDDLMQNTLGGAIGWWVYVQWFRPSYSINTKAAHE